MLSPDERWMAGLKALKRLKPALRTSRLRQKPFPKGDSNLSQGISRDLKEDESVGSYTRQASSRPSLLALLESTNQMPPYSVILGTCEDGLPFTLDLTNPAPGALLITGDAASGKTSLLRSILASATYLNPPNQVSFSIISFKPEEFAGISGAANCQGLHIPDEDATKNLLVALEKACEQRKRGSIRGPAMILAIDDLASFLQSTDTDLFGRFFSLVKHGPRSQIWIIATLSSEQADCIDERLMAAFRTPLVGSIIAPGLAIYLTGDPNSGAEDLTPGQQFCVPYGDEWIRFWVNEAA